VADRQLTFLTRPGCTLCAAGLQQLEPAARRLGVGIVTVDISAIPGLEAEYGTRIPVVLDRNGRVLAEGIITGPRAWYAALRARATLRRGAGGGVPEG
jgi:hypothetical protein